jgi:hypothetical protein
LGWKEWVHNPSLVQHTGEISQIDKRKPQIKHDPKFPRQKWGPHHLAQTFRGEQFDCLRFLEV